MTATNKTIGQICKKWGSVEAFAAVIEAFKATDNLYELTMRDLNAFGDALKAQGFMVVPLEKTQENDIQ